jgi:hypothetical protein
MEVLLDVCKARASNTPAQFILWQLGASARSRQCKTGRFLSHNGVIAIYVSEEDFTHVRALLARRRNNIREDIVASADNSPRYVAVRAALPGAGCESLHQSENSSTAR